MSIKFVDSSSQATNGEGWTQVPEFKTKGTNVQKNGVTHIIVAQEYKLASLLKRIGAIVMTCLTVGVPLIFENVRNLCFYGKEVTDFAVPAAQLETEKKKAVEAEKAKIEKVCNYRAVETVKAVGMDCLVGAVFGGLGFGAYAIFLERFAPISPLYVGDPVGMVASTAAAMAACTGTLALTDSIGFKEPKNVILSGVALFATLGASMASPMPKLTVAASLLAAAAVSTKIIFNHFNAKKEELIAELDKKVAPATAK